jgi:hypothetical protein
MLWGERDIFLFFIGRFHCNEFMTAWIHHLMFFFTREPLSHLSC